MSRWKTESHFASWLGLCPDNRISGQSGARQGHAPGSQPRCQRAATGCQHTHPKPQLPGTQYRRLHTKLGAPKATTAMAHRLARLVYRMLKYGQAYVDKGTVYYENGSANNKSRKRAAKVGLQVAEI